MNEQDRELSDEMLDRLVDGEVSEAEYQNVLRELDSQPDGWRRCSLAFLEAQAWTREFREVRQERKSSRVAPVASQWSWQLGGVVMLASAASFLLAFGLATHYAGRDSAPNVDQIVSTGKPTLPSEPTAETPDWQLAGGLTDSGIEDAEPWGRYRYVVDGGTGEPREFEMPVFAVDDPRAKGLLDEQASMPMKLIRALEASGNQVRPQRHWVPGQQGLDSPFFVPVDELKITPVSSRSFQ